MSEILSFAKNSMATINALSIYYYSALTCRPLRGLKVPRNTCALGRSGALEVKLTPEA